MLASNYEVLAMRTNDGKINERVKNETNKFDQWLQMCDHKEAVQIYGYDPGELLNGSLGLTGEAGEVADSIKKVIFHGHKMDRDGLVKELGDVCWYLALLCHAIDVPLEEVMSQNIEKLKKRYPDGFSETASINRTE
jgi:NTP pyrophosphatase (non-canonical NTP hydrolase)